MLSMTRLASVCVAAVALFLVASQAKAMVGSIPTEDVVLWLDVVIKVAAALGIGLALYKVGIKCVVPILQAARELPGIAAELRPNGGGTIRDAINRIEIRTNQIQIAVSVLTHSTRAHYDITDLVARFDANAVGEWTWINRMLSRWTGRLNEELLGLAWLSVVHDDDREHVYTLYERSIRDQREFRATFRLYDGSGGSFAVDALSVPFRFDGSDDPGSALRWAGVVRRIPPTHPKPEHDNDAD